MKLAAQARQSPSARPAQLTSIRVMGDPDRLQQAIWNLLSNAIKFTPSSGRVELRLEADADRGRISVIDTGVGISPEFLRSFLTASAGGWNKYARVHGHGSRASRSSVMSSSCTAARSRCKRRPKQRREILDRPSDSPPRADGNPCMSAAVWSDYLALTKPKVVALIVFTAIVGAFLARRACRHRTAVLGLTRIALAAGSAAAINHVLDRRIDEQMARTSGPAAADGRFRNSTRPCLPRYSVSRR